MNLIEEAFHKSNYISIPFNFNGVGHPTVVLTVKNESASFLLDTGASSNILDVEFAKKLDIPLINTGQKGGGAGGLVHDIFSLGRIELFYEKTKFSFDQFFAMDFETIKIALRTKSVQEDFQGILGFGFFKNNKCFIDYSNDRLFLLPE